MAIFIQNTNYQQPVSLNQINLDEYELSDNIDERVKQLLALSGFNLYNTPKKKYQTDITTLIYDYGTTDLALKTQERHQQDINNQISLINDTISIAPIKHKGTISVGSNGLNIIIDGINYSNNIQGLLELLHKSGYGRFLRGKNEGRDGLFGSGTANALYLFMKDNNIKGVINYKMFTNNYDMRGNKFATKNKEIDKSLTEVNKESNEILPKYYGYSQREDDDYDIIPLGNPLFHQKYRWSDGTWNDNPLPTKLFEKSEDLVPILKFRAGDRTGATNRGLLADLLKDLGIHYLSINNNNNKKYASTNFKFQLELTLEGAKLVNLYIREHPRRYKELYKKYFKT